MDNTIVAISINQFRLGIRGGEVNAGRWSYHRVEISLYTCVVLVSLIETLSEREWKSLESDARVYEMEKY